MASVLGKALSVAADKDQKKTTGGLAGALMRQDKGSALATTEAPKKSNLVAISDAMTSSQTANNAFGNKGICFVIDATGSREASWKEAQKMQAKMFDTIKSVGEGITVGVVCHRGERVETLGWFKSAESAKKRMAEVSCSTGQTRVCDALLEAAQGHDNRAPSSIILVGDCFEESYATIKYVAGQLKDQNIKVFAFLEGNDGAASEAFATVASMTGGAFKQFGQGLNLEDLCVAAATFDTGGKAAFDRLLQAGHSGAKALESQIHRKAIGSGSKPAFGR